MYKILIVEDDTVIAKTVAKHLMKWEFEVRYVIDFRNIREQFLEFDPQLVLLDITLPFYNGFYWCRRIREISKVPVIFISAASDNMNIVMAMDIGGDDFICKPFDLEVLTAKVHALLRRSYSFGNQVNVLSHRGAILNLNDTSLLYEGNKIELTKNDFRILQILMEHVGSVVSREAIMVKLWESDSYIDDNTLTVNITRLRKKLSDYGLSDFITTKKGIGYMIK